MAITAVGAVIYRPFQGFGDPGLPDSYWVAVGEIEGDVSGGSRILQFEFKNATQGLTTEAFSLEQFSFFDALNTVHTWAAQTGNMDFIPGAPADAIWNVGGGTIVGEVSATIDKTQLALPAYLGAPREPDAAAFLEVRTDNANLSVLNVVAQGFHWSGAAFMTQGGPRRPLGSIYGHG